MVNTSDWIIKHQQTDMEIPLLERILKERGVTIEELTKDVVYNPNMMKDMDKAVDRVLDSIYTKEKVLIYGDYDVDGTCSVKVVYETLQKLGVNCDYYIPDRLKDGYGITKKGMDYIIANEYDLVITVDCGITAVEEVDTMNCFGIDVIITDHHECKKELPQAIAVLDCKRPDNTYPFRELCGAGVAYKFMQAILMELDSEEILDELLMFTAIATIADMVPLVDENRTIVRKGLAKIKRTHNIPILSLLSITEKDKDMFKLTSQDIAYYVAPCINACSRIGNIDILMELLFCNDANRARELASIIAVYNNKRKEVAEQIMEEAQEQLLQTHDLKSTHPIVVYGDNWHKGVIGIVAGNLVEKYHKPAIVFGKGKDGYHGSCRSVGDINVLNILEYAKEHIITFGGHAGAAGLAVAADKINDFIQAANEYGNKNFNIESFRPVMEADMEILPSDITLLNIQSLKILEPFGMNNPEPSFVCRRFKVSTLRKIGKKEQAIGAHLSMMLKDIERPANTVDGIGFFMGEYLDIIPPGKNINVLFKLSENEYNGNTKAQLIIKDMHFKSYIPEGLGIEESELYTDDIITIPELEEEYGLEKADLLPTQAEYTSVFSAIKAYSLQKHNHTIITDLKLLSILTATTIEAEMNPFKLDRILETIADGGYLEYQKLLFDKVVIKMASNKKPRKKIVETSKYKKNHNITEGGSIPA